ncbi:DUF924 family protein [Inquilinus sp. CA228]|uniref:DUF924 family protein n=1 Tax=Inquilinus sp. CA228 TaxID=3455609 RepID=UPI003F8D6A4F
MDWRRVHHFWFPDGLDAADLETHLRLHGWWFGGGANAALMPLAPVLAAARAGGLAPWLATPLGRLSLILVLDQFPRGLFAGRAEAYAGDAAALRIARDGLANGHYDALSRPWEQIFFLMPLAHAEGPDHQVRLKQLVAMAELVAAEAPERLRPLYRFHVSQARSHLEVISRFGRFPHRNPILGRASTAAEAAYLAQGDLVHLRRPPGLKPS